MSEEERDNRKIQHGIRELSKKCPACGRPKMRHTIAEARTCAEDPKTLYPESVTPEKRYQLDLTRRRKK